MATTESNQHGPAEHPDTVSDTVSDTADVSEPTASPRGRARESSPDSTITLRTRLRGLAGEFNPPEIWDTPRPPLKSLVAYAKEAPWTGEGALRTLGQVYVWVVAVPAHAAGYYALWVIQRPARLICALLLVTLLALTPPGQWVRHLGDDVPTPSPTTTHQGVN